MINFQGFFDFFRRLARTKTEQITDKARKHNGHTIFLRYLVLHTHKQEWIQLCMEIYPIFITLTYNLHQLPFLPPLMLPPPTEYATPLNLVVKVHRPLISEELQPSDDAFLPLPILSIKPPSLNVTINLNKPVSCVVWKQFQVTHSV